ncbi:MAG TPA: hypothetical protein VH062_00335 [Polyangiaceae bacterium]|nr:hypothetical protein [Polyangiaceae bacterium]
MVRTSDAIMLMAARQFLDGEANVFKLAEENVLVVVDLRDAVGAVWACMHLGLLDDADDDDDLARAIIRTFVESVLSYEGNVNPHPFVAFWAPRGDGLLDWLRSQGSGVPPDWYPTIESAPQAGNVHTILKRNGAGVMMSVDYAHIVSLVAPAATGGKK